MSKSRGIAVDSLYRELMEMFPYYFPEDIYNASDELEHIIEVYLSQTPEKAEDTKRAMMYVWQLAINGRVIIGRTWEEFIELIKQIQSHFHLDEKRRMIVYIHNLSYEMGFLESLFTWDKVFAIEAHKPIYALTGGIEFRCSYLLSNMSLANIGLSLKKYKVRKLVGDLDYELTRHFKTQLQYRELRYCINDVLCLSAFLPL